MENCLYESILPPCPPTLECHGMIDRVLEPVGPTPGKKQLMLADDGVQTGAGIVRIIQRGQLHADH